MRRILIAGFLVFSVGFGIISSANAQSAPGTEGLWAQLRALQSQLTLLMSQASQQGLSVSGVSPSVVSPSVLSQPTVVQEATRPGYITLEEVQGSPRVSCTLPSIKSRSSGPSVYLLQLLLKQEGSYPEGFVTGYYGRLTQAAVSRFQSSRGIPATGIVDAATAKQLTELTGKFYPEECGSVPKPTQDRLELLAPREGEAVSTTFTIAGYAYGWFEGNVPVKVRDTNGTTLFDGSVTASNNYDAPAYFKKEITLIQKPTTDSGWIEFTEYSERDGTLQYQKTVKIRFTTTGGQQCEYARPPQGCRWEGSMTYPQCEARLVCGATGNSGHVYQFDNINGFYVLRGDNLKSVQLWSIPTGTEITPAYYKHFDDMTLESDGSQFDVLPGSVRTQKWSKKVKECPLATNVFARAFDATGQQLPDVNLPVTGASALYEYLCGTTNQASITVTSPNGGETFKAGQQITVNWKTNSVPTNQELIVSLELSKSGKDGRVAFFGTLNDGSEIITIPKNIISGSFYKIFIETPGIDAQTQLYVKDYSDNYFTIISSTSTGPVISGVSGPQTLNVSQTGTWTVTVSARSGGNLSYSVDWGDGRNYEAGGMAFEQKMVTNDQSATFTHSYSRAGTYTPTFTVTNQSGQSAQTSLSVNVGGTTTPSITVTSPTAGNVFDNSGVKDSGLITTIQWQSSNLGTAAVSIELDDMAGNFVKAIAGWIASTGTYSWKYDPAIPDGNYKIKIYAAWPTGTEGRSGVFSLTGNNGGSSAAITVTSPNGGEIWASTPTLTDSLSGFTQYRKDITWSGAPDDPFNRIEAYLEQQVGGQYQTIGRIPPFAFGSVAWVVGIVSKKLDCNPVNGECFRDGNMSIVPPGRYFVRVVDRQTGAWDRSDAPFTITGQQVSSITVTSPQAGETWRVGEKYEIRWTKLPTGVAPEYVSLALTGANGTYFPITVPGALWYRDGQTAYVWEASKVYDSNGHQWTDVKLGEYKISLGYSTPGASHGRITVSSGLFKVVKNDQATNLGPVISGVSGPQSLNVNQQGTWTVSVSSNSGGNLSYSVDWGDGRNYEAGNMGIEERMITNDQSAVFTHSYSRAGTYTPTFTVANTNGQSAQTSLSVNVGGVIPTSSITVTSPQAGETWQVGEQRRIAWTTNDPTMRALLAGRVSITLNNPYPACLDSVPACSILIRSPYVIAKDVLDTGSYAWSIPTNLPDAYRGAAQITVTRTSAPTALGRSGTFEISRMIQPPSTVSLDVQLASTPTSGTYPPGSQNVPLVGFSFRAVNGPVRIDSIIVNAGALAGQLDTSEVAYLALYDGQTVVGGYTELEPGNHIRFRSLGGGGGIIIPSGQTKTLTLRGQLSPYATIGDIYAFYLLTTMRPDEVLAYDENQNRVLITGTAANFGGTVRITVGRGGGTVGDVNGDGSITCADTAMILQSVTGSITLTADQKARADVDGNGLVQAYDAALLAQKYNLSCGTTSAITVTSPQQGETWRVGENRAIRWSVVRPENALTMRISFVPEVKPCTAPPGAACTLSLVAPYVISEYAPSTGSYTWTIPSDLPSSYHGQGTIVINVNGTDVSGTSGTFNLATLQQTNNLTFSGADISSISSITKTTGGSVYLITIYNKSQAPLVSIVSDTRAADGLAKITAMAEQMNKIIGDSTQQVTIKNLTFYDIIYTFDGARSGYSAFTDAVTISQALGGAAPSGGTVAGAATGPSREELSAQLSAITQRLYGILNQLR